MKSPRLYKTIIHNLERKDVYKRQVRRLKLCDERALKQMNQLVFKLFLPCTLFNNILSTDLKTVLQPQLLILSLIHI